MIVNGATIPNQSVWCQTVSVVPDTDSILQFSINGELLGMPFTPAGGAGVCDWEEFNEVWNSGTNTTALICLLNQNTFGEGNDFALDDKTCPVPVRLRLSVVAVLSKMIILTNGAMVKQLPLRLTSALAHTALPSQMMRDVQQ